MIKLKIHINIYTHLYSFLRADVFMSKNLYNMFYIKK